MTEKSNLVSDTMYQPDFALQFHAFVNTSQEIFLQKSAIFFKNEYIVLKTRLKKSFLI
jgi:hypothetical protein